MRIRLLKKDLLMLFSEILKREKNLSRLAFLLNINKRTLNDWKMGKATIPVDIFKKFIDISGLKKSNLNFEILPEFWYIKKAAKKGAYARIKLHGNFGTQEGRRKGGLASLATHRKLGTKFTTLKNIKLPELSDELAEFLGILFGDGHLSLYQASITTNSETDMDHALFTREIIHKLFGFIPSIKNKKGENTVNVVASSKKMVSFLNELGMPIGNKIKKSLRVPLWIFKRNSYKKAFIRGLFDTDGCIYIDTHKNKDKIYRHFGWTITSYAENFIIDIIKLLKDLGYPPTHRQSQKSVYLRKQKEIKRYFSEIGSSNPKHLKRFKIN